jgi:hypothetical protein
MLSGVSVAEVEDVIIPEFTFENVNNSISLEGKRVRCEQQHIIMKPRAFDTKLTRLPPDLKLTNAITVAVSVV